MLNKADSYTRR